MVPLSAAERRPLEVLLAGAWTGTERRLMRLELAGDVVAPQWSGPRGDSLAGSWYAVPLHGALFTQQTLYTP